MTTCPSCGRPLSGRPGCASCAAVPPLPDGLFRDDAVAGGGELVETATFTPDFLPAPVPDPRPPELPDDLFRDASPGPAPAFPEVAAAASSHLPYDDAADRSFGFRQFGAADTAGIPVVAAPQVPPLPAPGRPGTPEADLLPSERVPMPRDAARSRSGAVLLVILVLLVAAAVVGGTLWWNSPQVAPSGVASVSRRASLPPSAASSAASTPETSPPAPVASSPQAAPVVFPPPGARVCSERIAVNESTSCPFAANVAAALPTLAAGESRTITATSPTTGQTYQMTCRLVGYVTCTGGSNAVVYVKVTQ